MLSVSVFQGLARLGLCEFPIPCPLGLKPCLSDLHGEFSLSEVFTWAIHPRFVFKELTGHKVPCGPSQNRLSPSHQKKLGKCWSSCPFSFRNDWMTDLFPVLPLSSSHSHLVLSLVPFHIDPPLSVACTFLL